MALLIDVHAPWIQCAFRSFEYILFINRCYFSSLFIWSDYCRDESDCSDSSYVTKGFATMDVFEYEVDDLSDSEDLYSYSSSSGTDVWCLQRCFHHRHFFYHVLNWICRILLRIWLKLWPCWLTPIAAVAVILAYLLKTPIRKNQMHPPIQSLAEPTTGRASNAKIRKTIPCTDSVKNAIR